MGKPTIRLSQTDSLGLIILMKTGVLVSNQTGGYSCLQSEAEGVYVPLGKDARELEEFFSDVNYVGLDEKMADHIDGILVRDAITRFLRVDRSRLEESHEAWVFVDMLAVDGDPGAPLISGFSATKGILTWPNSD